jgi:uncharacterized protein (TIGR03067 family)
MRRFLAAVALSLVTIPMVAQTKPPAVPKPLLPFQGTWVLTTPDGQSLAGDQELTLTITGDRYAQSVGGAVNERGTFKIDATRKPMWLDLTITEGNDAGKHQVGIVEVKGDTMRGALKLPGTPCVRPPLPPNLGSSCSSAKSARSDRYVPLARLTISAPIDATVAQPHNAIASSTSRRNISSSVRTPASPSAASAHK